MKRTGSRSKRVVISYRFCFSLVENACCLILGSRGHQTFSYVNDQARKAARRQVMCDLETRRHDRS